MSWLSSLRKTWVYDASRCRPENNTNCRSKRAPSTWPFLSNDSGAVQNVRSFSHQSMSVQHLFSVSSTATVDSPRTSWQSLVSIRVLGKSACHIITWRSLAAPSELLFFSREEISFFNSLLDGSLLEDSSSEENAASLNKPMASFTWPGTRLVERFVMLDRN